MKKLLMLLLAVFPMLSIHAQDILIDTKGEYSFHASTPLEDIDATSKQGIGAINVKTKDVLFKAKMETFVFRRALMQEHFNEDYMESEKYPWGTFKGSIDQDVDLSKDGSYPVTVTGDFTVHGIAQHRTIPGTVVVKGNSIEVTAAFDVKLVDHNIKVPSVVSAKIAEVVKVNVHCLLVPPAK